jgi:hypothetical protein
MVTIMVISPTWLLWLMLPIFLFFLKTAWTMAMNPRAEQEKAIRLLQGRPMPNVPQWLAPHPTSERFVKETRRRGIFGIVVSGGALLLVIAALGDSWIRR